MNKERAKAIAASSSEPIVILDSERRVVVANSGAASAVNGLEPGRRLGEESTAAHPELLVLFLESPPELPAYQELRQGFTAAVSHELRTPLARLLVLLESATLPGADVDELMELARDTDLEDGPAIRNQQVRGKIADWYVQQQGLKLTRYRTLTALSKGQTPGPESSIIKIVAAPKMQDMGAFAMELMGPAGIMKEDVPQAAGFQAQWIGGAGFRIAGGTDEILRNIVAERVLGMPADVRVDKDVPFNQLGKG